MVQLEYPSLGRQYPSLYLNLPKETYQKEKEKYQELTPELVWKMITQEVLERLPKEDDWEIAEKVYQELTNAGMEKTVVRELSGDEVEDLDPEAEAEGLAEAILSILNRERTLHEN